MEINNPYGFIYITTNMINGKKYIGQRRYYKGWEKYLGSGVNITRAIEKYGSENFKKDIIYIANSQKELNEKEIYFIEKYNALNNSNFYNIAKGGYDNPLEGKSKKEIELIHKKISKTLKGKVFTLEDKKKLQGIPKKFKSEEDRKKHKEKISKSVSGMKNGRYGTHIKIKLSQSTKEKIRKSHLGMKYNDDFKKKMREVRSIKVVCVNTNEIFESAKKAGEYYNISPSHITQCCKGKAKSCGKIEDGTKLIWKYYSPK